MSALAHEGIPLDIFRVVHLPTRDLHGFLIELRDVPRTLVEVFKVLTESGIKILRCFIYSKDGAEVILLCDITKMKFDLRMVEDGIRKLEGVKSLISIKQFRPGFFIDYVNFPLTISEKRVVMLDLDELRGFVKDIRDEWGSAGDVFCYYSGLNIGRCIWRGYESILEALSPPDKFELVGHIFKAYGFGRMEVVKVDVKAPSATLRFYELFECLIGRPSKKPYSQLMRGILATIAARVFDREMYVREVMCIAKGDPFCEFNIYSR